MYTPKYFKPQVWSMATPFIKSLKLGRFFPRAICIHLFGLKLMPHLIDQLYNAVALSWSLDGAYSVMSIPNKVSSAYSRQDESFTQSGLSFINNKKKRWP